jgi:hypothetical protein
VIKGGLAINDRKTTNEFPQPTLTLIFFNSGDRDVRKKLPILRLQAKNLESIFYSIVKMAKLIDIAV